MKLIPLTQGFFAMVDDADYAAVSQFKWCAHRVGRRVYAARNVLLPNGKRTLQHLHCFLIPSDLDIDHRDGNGVNCQRYNMREATRAQNIRAKCRKRSGTLSTFRGVSRCSDKKKWRAYIKKDYKYIHIGHFNTEVEAARAYDEYAGRLFGVEFSDPNFPV